MNGRSTGIYLGRGVVALTACLALAGVAHGAAAGGRATEVSGSITQDTTWEVTDSPFRMVGTVTIEDGATLDVDKGVTVIAERGVALIVRGALSAVGNPREVVTFSCVDAFAGCWEGIEVFPSSAETEVKLDHAEVEFARAAVVQHPDALGYISDSLIRFNQDGITVTPASQVDRNAIVFNGGAGVRNPGPEFKHSLVTQNPGIGVEVLQDAYGSPPSFSTNSIFGNGSRGNRVDLKAAAGGGTWEVSAENNFWGSTDPGTIAAHIVDGRDEPDNSAIVEFDPYSQLPHAQVAAMPSRLTWANASLAGDRSVEYGDSIKLKPGIRSRTFRDCSASQGDPHLVVTARPVDGTGKKKVLGEGAAGSVVEARLKETSVVRVRLLHDVLYCATESLRRVEVFPRLSFRAPERASSMRFAVRGRIAPPHKRGVVIQQRVGGRWERIASATVSGDGRFRALVRAGGDHMVVRARFLGDRDHAPASSEPQRVDT